MPKRLPSPRNVLTWALMSPSASGVSQIGPLSGVLFRRMVSEMASPPSSLLWSQCRWREAGPRMMQADQLVSRVVSPASAATSTSTSNRTGQSGVIDADSGTDLVRAPGGRLLPLPLVGTLGIRLESTRGIGPIVSTRRAAGRLRPEATGARVEIVGGEQPEGVALGDLDGDGDLDLVTANETSGDIAIHLNDGAGGVQETRLVAMSPGLTSVALADFDGDGRLDVAAGEHVRLGRGDGTFGRRVSVVPGFEGGNVRAADLDGDGDVDIAGGRTGILYLRHGRGDGTFEPDLVVVRMGCTRFELADMNGDGLLDIVGCGSMQGADGVRAACGQRRARERAREGGGAAA